jgi:hypothetical protein
VHRLRSSPAELEEAARRGGDWYARLSWTTTAAAYTGVMDAKMARA